MDFTVNLLVGIRFSDFYVLFQEDLDRQYYQDPMPNMSVQKSNMPRQGVVKFTPEQLNNVVDAILSTANKVQVPRCGASYLLFMALRHTDNTNDDNLLKVRTSRTIGLSGPT